MTQQLGLPMGYGGVVVVVVVVSKPTCLVLELFDPQ